MGCLPSWINRSSATFYKNQKGNYLEGKQNAFALAGIICSRVANCTVAAVIALTAAPRALPRREVLLPALMSAVSPVSSGYHQYL